MPCRAFSRLVSLSRMSQERFCGVAATRARQRRRRQRRGSSRGVKPCRGSLTGFNARDSCSHTVLRGRKGLGGGAEAAFPAGVLCLPPLEQCPDVVALAGCDKGVPKVRGWDTPFTCFRGMGCCVETHGAALPCQEELVVQNSLQGTA